MCSLSINPDSQFDLFIFNNCILSSIFFYLETKKFVSLLILDTICFSDEARRFNEVDIQIAEKLESILKDYSLSRNEVYNQLQDAKNSIATLTFKEILLKDMKLVNPFDNLKAITSSISGRLVGNLILSEQQDQILADLKEFSNEHNCSLVLIMGINRNNLNSIERDMAIYSSNDNLLKKVF